MVSLEKRSVVMVFQRHRGSDAEFKQSPDRSVRGRYLQCLVIFLVSQLGVESCTSL